MIKSLLFATLLFAGFKSQSQLLKNGSFEVFTGTTCVLGAPGCAPCYGCATGTVMPFWHVDAGDIDILKINTSNSNLSAGVPSGLFGIDLNGATPGTMSQEVSNLVASTPYTLSFSYSNNDIDLAGCAYPDKPFVVTVYDENNDTIVFNTYHTNLIFPPATQPLSARFNRWGRVTLPFTPASNFAKIEFRSLFGSSAPPAPVPGCGFGAGSTFTIYGPTLDSIVLDGLVLLPIRLLSFDGTYASSALNLKWKTADEESLVKMIVQYDNGSTWTEIASLPAKGNRGSNDYAISIPATAVNNAANVSLRLKLLNADNKITYSNVIYLQSRPSKKIGIYPNPVTKNLLNVYGLEGGESIMIYNSIGQLLLTRKAAGALERIDLGTNAAGIYNVTVVDKSGAMENIKFVKSN